MQLFLDLSFFKYSSDLPPLKYKNKISIKLVKALQKIFLLHFFLLVCGGGGEYFCFFIVWLDIKVKEKQISQRFIVVMLHSSVCYLKPFLPRLSKLLPIFPGGRSHFSLNFCARLDPT